MVRDHLATSGCLGTMVFPNQLVCSYRTMLARVKISPKEGAASKTSLCLLWLLADAVVTLQFFPMEITDFSAELQQLLSEL